MERSVLFLMMFALASVSALRERRQANGCGTGFVQINRNLDMFGEGVIIPCCDQHDICYDTCGTSQTQCDRNFKQCLISACRALTGNGYTWWIATRRALCELDGRTFYVVVKSVGYFAYRAAQNAHGCR